MNHKKSQMPLLHDGGIKDILLSDPAQAVIISHPTMSISGVGLNKTCSTLLAEVPIFCDFIPSKYDLTSLFQEKEQNKNQSAPCEGGGKANF